MSVRSAVRRIAVLGAIKIAILVGGISNAEADSITLPVLLERFDRAQETTRSMVAKFTEEKRLRLLLEPRTTRGEFVFLRPNMVRWEYAGPAPRIFVLTESRYLAYDPAARRAEDVDIKAFVGKRLFRFLGFGQSSSELAKYYDLGISPDNVIPGTHLLLLTPRKRRVRDRLTAMRIWVDARTFLPRQVTYEDSGGDSTLLRFDEIRVNSGVDSDRFDLVLPAGVAVSRSYEGFSIGDRGF
jgi:outer membrane lipoprotein-sorting protein